MTAWEALALPANESVLQAQALTGLPEGPRTYDNCKPFFAPCAPVPLNYLDGPRVLAYSLFVVLQAAATFELDFKADATGLFAVMIYTDDGDGPQLVDLVELVSTYQLTPHRPRITVEFQTGAFRQG